ncbi:MAG: PD40 domain-containing protein [Candidatus Aminicenantes bacterium]|nr:PD40 domain-containing protein [Candidatus Aminicenantes bacterium]
MNKRIFSVFFMLVLSFSLSLWAVTGINIKDTRLLSHPAVSKSHIAFVYANDLYVAGIDGSAVRRLTSAKGMETDPFFSPDGKLIAFSGEYDGSRDVFVVPVAGGVPKRLTYHPNDDLVRGFTPDGSAVLFISNRSVFSRRFDRLFTVPVQGGFPRALDIPNAFRAAYSPDGKRMAYTPLSEPFGQWKHYRGGRTTRTWLYTFSDHAVEQVSQPKGRCNDTDPVWIGDRVYFRSDRNGEFNLFSYDTQSKKIKQLTQFKDFPILKVAAGAGNIIFEQAGYLHLFDMQQKSTRKLTIGVAADLQEVRPRYAKNPRFIRNAAISPSGARALFEYRGEIVTLPAEKGDPRILTNTSGSHERSPAWSPDGKSIAYFSDAGGEYKLHIQARDGKGKVKIFKVKGAGFYNAPVWSPDNKKIAYNDNSKSLYWIDLDSGKCKRIAGDYQYAPGAFPSFKGNWSPDSKWIAYAVNTSSSFRRVYVYSIQRDKSFPITDGMSDANEPVFDKSGKYLYFFASTDAGPVVNWFDMSNEDMRFNRSIYLTVLPGDLPSPLSKESDEEKGSAGKEEDKKEKNKGKGKAKTTSAKSVTIDFEGIETRILTLPLPAGSYTNLQAGDEGNLFYLEAEGLGVDGDFYGTPKLKKFDLKKRKSEELLSKVENYFLSADKKKVLYRMDRSWSITSAAGKIKPGKGKLKTDDIQVKIDPAAEWRQIFDEAWRINRDYFYDPNMHGADWPGMREKYSVFLPHLSCRADLNRVIRWMCSELAVGHHGVRGGDYLETAEEIPGGLLGADYVIENGRYRFKKVYGGLNWTPDLRSPLTEPGINVKAGEYLLKVNGREVKAPDNLYRFFENTAEKIVEITVGPDAGGKNARTVKVVPIRGENALRNRAWIEANIEKVDKASGGRVAYVYVPNTAGRGYVYFKRYFFPQAHKEAIIVDERFNSGGSVADYYIDILLRPYTCSWATRYGADFKSPGASIQGPKVMIIDETAGSGGDLLPWMFRKFKLGKLVGKRTWGGLVGTLGYPTLMDGGRVTAPNVGFWTKDGFLVENEGVPPDIEVEQWPAEMIKGRDPQLEKAIEVIMKELKKNPPEKRKRPPFPIRVKK